MQTKSKIKDKKKLIIIIAVIVALALIGTVILIKSAKNDQVVEDTGPIKKRISKPVNLIPVSERPYMKLTPDPTGHYITIAIIDLKKDATKVLYEMEYMTGSMLQGFQGNMDIAQIPTEDKKLFGSKSAGGAVTYHQDISGGNLVTEFVGGAEDYALKSDWKYFTNSKSETDFSSKDAKFQISSENLAKHSYVVIFNSSGYPKGIENVVSDPYSITTSKSSMDGKATLIMRANEEGELMIAGYDGEEWHEFKGELDGKMITADVDLMELYVVVKK
jgi:hypothetical protein